MDNIEKLTLIDPETNKAYTLKLSKDDVTRARTDMRFASALLRYATKLSKAQKLVNNVGTENIPPKCPENPKMSPINEPIAMCQAGPSVETTPNQRIDDTGMHNWSEAETLALIQLYKENETVLESGKVTGVQFWKDISDKLFKDCGYSISGRKCTSKFQSLKRTYKNVKDNNNKSGNGRTDWEYFEAMEDLCKEKPWMAPLFTAGSDSNNFHEPLQPTKRESTTTTGAYLKALLKHKEAETERREKRHKEKMDALVEVRALMEKYLDK